MSTDNPHIRAVPNPPSETNETKELIKTVALTAAVSSLVGVFAVAGGQAIYELLKRAVGGGKKATAPPSARQPFVPDEEDDMPESLRMRPHLRQSGRRKNTGDLDRIMNMFKEFEKRQDDRLRRMEERMDEQYEDEDEEEDAA